MWNQYNEFRRGAEVISLAVPVMTQRHPTGEPQDWDTTYASDTDATPIYGVILIPDI
jgi:hypothetical protein